MAGKWDCVDRAVSWMFLRLGRWIGRQPGYFIIVPLLLACLLGTGLQRIRYEDDPEYLFTPTNGRSKVERTIVETMFPMNSSRNFDLGRITRPGHFGRVIVVAKDCGTLLREQVFNEVAELDMIIQNITIYAEGRLWNYQNLCAKTVHGGCFRNDILDFEPVITDIENGTYQLRYPLMEMLDVHKTLFLAGFLGGVTTDDEGFVQEALAVNLMYHLDWSTPRAKDLASNWEEIFLRTVGSLEFDSISLAMFVSSTLADELEKNSQSVLPFLSLTLVIMFVFSILTCMMADWVTSKPWLGVIGCLSSIMGVGAAFGLVIYCGLEFIGINLAGPFLMLGIGMDDSFVLLAAWRRTDPRLNVVERMGQTYSDAAVSVTITSLTNFISFWIGAITPFPSVRIFCIYTATAVIFTYIYQVTFFGGCMAISGYAEHRNLHSMFCVPTMPKSLARQKNLFYRFCCTGGKNEADLHNPADNKEHSLMVFFRDKMGRVLNRLPVKIIVVVCFLGYLGVGIWGCLHVREGLERQKLSRSDSYSVDFYDREDKYLRKYAYRIQIVINATMNYADPKVQQDVEQILQTFEASPYIAGPNLTESWLRAYNRFLEDERTGVILQSYNKTDPEDFMQLLDFFLNFPLFEVFKQDILFDEDRTAITGTRYVVQALDISDANKEKDMVIALRNIADSFPFSVTVFQQYFIYFDQFILVRETSIQSICVAVAVMMVISLIFIPNINCAIWVAFSIISIEIGVIGYMTLWGVNLDSISMINLIMCIGFSVDYSAHISYAYFSAPKSSPDEGVRSALHSLGLPIFQGSISTILGVVALAFAPSYIFLTFFKTVFLVILFGALHGILLLPVLLSLSDSCCRRTLGRGKTKTAEKNGGPDNSVLIPRPSFRTNLPNIVVTDLGVAEKSGGDDDSGNGSKSSDSWLPDSADKDLGLGTSGESSDGSWKTPRRDKPRSQLAAELAHRLHADGARREEHVNPAFVPDDAVEPRLHSASVSSSFSLPRDRMSSYRLDPGRTDYGRSSLPTELNYDRRRLRELVNCPTRQSSSRRQREVFQPRYIHHRESEREAVFTIRL